jgi:curved DNA-binding protein CbpA
MRRRSPHDVLDLPPAADYDEARAAYRRLAAIFHPDRFVEAPPDVRAEASKQMGYLNEAWSELQRLLRVTTRASHRSATPTAGGDADDDGFAARARLARNRQAARRRSSSAASTGDAREPGPDGATAPGP